MRDETNSTSINGSARIFSILDCAISSVKVVRHSLACGWLWKRDKSLEVQGFKSAENILARLRFSLSGFSSIDALCRRGTRACAPARWALSTFRGKAVSSATGSRVSAGQSRFLTGLSDRFGMTSEGRGTGSATEVMPFPISRRSAEAPIPRLYNQLGSFFIFNFAIFAGSVIL